MTQAVDLPLRASRRNVYGLVGGVSLAHFVSHYYMFVLAPLLLYVREEYDVSYTKLGIAVALFNLISAAFQTPVGFLVDRLGARVNLIAGLALGGAALVVVGLVDSFWMMVAMYGVLGLANTVYHPADYAMLANHVPDKQIGHAFSVHTFSGFLGGAVAPAASFVLYGIVGWRGAFVAAGIMGFIAAAVLMLLRDPPAEPNKVPSGDATSRLSGWRLLLSPPILVNLVLFMLIGMIAGGFSNYLVVALIDLHHTPVGIANTALSTQLFTSAAGVLLGGLLLSLTSRHAMVTVVSLAITGLATLVVGVFDVGTIALMLLMALSGLAGGAMSPSRDMIVRSVAPPGAVGSVFGFVTNGFSMTGIVSPLIYGLMMDHGHPSLIFFTVGAAALLGVVTVLIGARYRA
jgi:FSR family fosmidomycin resistance protein-like MFS transporter